MSAHYFSNPRKHPFLLYPHTVITVQQEINAKDECYYLFAAFRTKQTQQNLIFYNQVTFKRNKEDEVTAIKIPLRHYKHSNPAELVKISIYRAKPVCPIYLMLAYASLRGTSPGPLFCWPDLSPISRNSFTKALGNSLSFCDLDVSHYKSHRFRNGGASWAASKAMSDTQTGA